MVNEAKENIQKIKNNIEAEVKILREISTYRNVLEKGSIEEKKSAESAIKLLKSSIKTINDSIPSLLKGVNSSKKLPGRIFGKKHESINLMRGSDKISVSIDIKDKKKFIKDLRISEAILKKVKRGEKAPGFFEKKEEVVKEFRKARGYLKLSNRFFLEAAGNLIRKGYFGKIKNEIRKANIDILFQTYIAMIILSTVIAFIVGIISFALLLVLGVGIIISLLVFIGLPLITFFMIYAYPAAERKSLNKILNQELPFAVIHMSAISGSGIEPTKIFQIIGLSDEYPNLRKEIRKVTNQINLYGYDLVTALNNASKTTSSEKLAALFSGLSTTINTGGDLKQFFEKRAETLLLNYRLEREAFSKIASTFMDIYISVVIATPMILLLLLIMLSLSGIELPFGPTQMSVGIISAVVLVNILFLVVLRLKQPSY